MYFVGHDTILKKNLNYKCVNKFFRKKRISNFYASS